MNSYLYEVLDRLIAFDTVSSNSDILAMEYLADEFDRLGFKTALHRSEIARAPQANLVAWAGPPTADGLIISGHLDTVPFAGQPGWEREPLRMEAIDERIFGRGTTDMKGFIAQCADAARILDQPDLRRPVVFIFTASEEIGGLGAQRVAPELSDLLGDVPCPSLAWIGEPTSWAIHAAHKSAVVVDITVRGKGGHSGAPDQGVNAIAVAGKVPLYLETAGQDPGVSEGGDAVGLEIIDTASDKSFFFIPGCAAINDRLRHRLAGAALVFFDGTLWRDDEMIRMGVGNKTGRRMGHMSMSGEDGTIAAFRDLVVGRRIFIHINNSNPALLDDSAERHLANEAGWEIAYDGMEVRL